MNYINHKPIYLQIAHDIVLKLYNGSLPKASLLPSVRELSIDYKVTPKTIQAVTKYLSDFHIIDTKAGVGSVITNDEKIIKMLHKKHGEENTKEYLSAMKQLSYLKEDILAFIQKQLEEE